MIKEPWCSGLTCLPVTQKIAGSNPVGSVSIPLSSLPSKPHALIADPTPRSLFSTCLPNPKCQHAFPLYHGVDPFGSASFTHSYTRENLAGTFRSALTTQHSIPCSRGTLLPAQQGGNTGLQFKLHTMRALFVTRIITPLPQALAQIALGPTQQPCQKCNHGGDRTPLGQHDPIAPQHQHSDLWSAQMR